MACSNSRRAAEFPNKGKVQRIADGVGGDLERQFLAAKNVCCRRSFALLSEGGSFDYAEQGPGAAALKHRRLPG